MAAHDLRDPINNLEGLVQTLRGELPTPPTPAVGALLQMMQESVQRFQRTLEQLGAVLQVHQAADQSTPPVELVAVVDDVRQDLLPALQQTGGHLEVAEAACPVVTIPAKSLRSMLYNLFSTALKYPHPDRPPYVRSDLPEPGRVLVPGGAGQWNRLRGEHRIAYHNPAHQQLSGGHDLVGRPMVEGMPPVAAQHYPALLDGVYRTGQPQYDYEVPYEVQDATDGPLRLAYFHFTFSAYREGGEIVGVSIFTYDVTEQVMARQ